MFAKFRGKDTHFSINGQISCTKTNGMCTNGFFCAIMFCFLSFFYPNHQLLRLYVVNIMLLNGFMLTETE